MHVAHALCLSLYCLIEWVKKVVIMEFCLVLRESNQIPIIAAILAVVSGIESTVTVAVCLLATLLSVSLFCKGAWYIHVYSHSVEI